jgi:hypothetical protein
MFFIAISEISRNIRTSLTRALWDFKILNYFQGGSSLITGRMSVAALCCILTAYTQLRREAPPQVIYLFAL